MTIDTTIAASVSAAQVDLENALTDIAAIAAILKEIGKTDSAACYLADRLFEHSQAADNAFGVLFLEKPRSTGGAA